MYTNRINRIVKGKYRKTTTTKKQRNKRKRKIDANRVHIVHILVPSPTLCFENKDFMRIDIYMHQGIFHQETNSKRQKKENKKKIRNREKGRGKDQREDEQEHKEKIMMQIHVGDVDVNHSRLGEPLEEKELHRSKNKARKQGGGERSKRAERGTCRKTITTFFSFFFFFFRDTLHSPFRMYFGRFRSRVVRWKNKKRMDSKEGFIYVHHSQKLR